MMASITKDDISQLMNAKKAKALRKRARNATQHMPDLAYETGKTLRLGECSRGAYKALKKGAVEYVAVQP